MTLEHARELVRAARKVGWRAPPTGGLADGRSVRDFDPEQVARGLVVELEHTDDAALAMRIAMDHLSERGDYYELLEKLERAPRAANPTTKRLMWISRQYDPEVLAMVMIAFAEATGDHGARDAMSNLFLWRPGGQPAPTAKSVMDYARQRLVVQKHTRYDRYLPWLAREMNRVRKDLGAKWWASRAAEMLTNQFRAVVDWAEANRVDLNRYSWPEALREAQSEGERRRIEGMPQGEVVYQFEDGWTVQELKTQDQLDAEGDVMQHCVGDYNPAQIGISYRIFSLRDPSGAPHVTMEWSPSGQYVVQLRGKQNDAPARKYLERMIGFREAVLEPKTGWEQLPWDAEKAEALDVFSEQYMGSYRSPKGELYYLFRDRDGDAVFVSTQDVRRAFDNIQEWLDKNWHWEPPPNVSEDEFEEAEQEALEEAFRDAASHHSLSRSALVTDIPEPAQWQIFVDHGLTVPEGSEDEMVHWLEGGEWSPQCRFLGRAANVGELRRHLMPPQSRFSRF